MATHHESRPQTMGRRNGGNLPICNAHHPTGCARSAHQRSVAFRSQLIEWQYPRSEQAGNQFSQGAARPFLRLPGGRIPTPSNSSAKLVAVRYNDSSACRSSHPRHSRVTVRPHGLRHDVCIEDDHSNEAGLDGLGSRPTSSSSPPKFCPKAANADPILTRPSG